MNTTLSKPALQKQNCQFLDALTHQFPESTEYLKHISALPKGDIMLSMIQDLASSTNAGKVQPGIDRNFVSTLIHLVAQPSSLNQGGDITCTQCADLYLMLKHKPSEVLRIAKELATSGHATVLDGSVITYDKRFVQPDTKAECGRFDPREKAEKLLQLALFKANSTTVSIADNNGNISSDYGTSPRLFIRQREQTTGKQIIAIANPEDIRRYIHSSIKEDGGRALAGQTAAVNMTKSGIHQLHAMAIDHVETEKSGEVSLVVYHGWQKYFPEMGGIPRSPIPGTGLEKIALKDFISNVRILTLSSDDKLAASLNIKDSLLNFEAQYPEANFVPNDLSGLFISPKKNNEDIYKLTPWRVFTEQK